MKSLFCMILGSVFMASTAIAAPLSAKDLEGKYVITTDLQPGVENQITINQDGSYEFTELAGGSGFNCAGDWVLKKDMVIAHLDCPMGDESVSFTQILELDGLSKSDLKKGAETNAHSSLFGLAMPVPVKLKKN